VANLFATNARMLELKFHSAIIFATNARMPESIFPEIFNIQQL
jgi:hypothetical protein